MFLLSEGRKHGAACVVYGCSDRRDEKRGSTSTKFREKETKMDFIREWKSKTLDPEQVFGGVIDASQRRFHSHVFFQPTVPSGATEAC